MSAESLGASVFEIRRAEARKPQRGPENRRGRARETLYLENGRSDRNAVCGVGRVFLFPVRRVIRGNRSSEKPRTDRGGGRTEDRENFFEPADRKGG